jgi:hypothetical protein
VSNIQERIDVRIVCWCTCVSLLSACGHSELRLPVPPGMNGNCSPELLTALDARDEVAIRDLVARGAIGSCEKTATRLETAIRQGRSGAVRLLLEAGADPNASPPGEFQRAPRALALALEGHAFDETI